MAAQLLDGKAIADQIRLEVGAEVARLREKTGKTPGLDVVLVGNDPASEVYVRNKGIAAGKAGLRHQTHHLPESTSTESLLAEIDRLNRDQEVDGILVQLPLPRQIDKDRVLLAVLPEKDVDGFHPVNVGHLVANREGFVACTPAGVMELLRRSKIPIEGREAVVLGRSDIVGKPMALLLLHQSATVTVCHSRTRALAEVTRRADILIAAIGKPGMVTEEHVKPGAVVIDVGINRVDDPALARSLLAADPRRLAQFEKTGTCLIGDCHPTRVAEVASALTPVPGGVGPLTIAMLLDNTLRGFRRHRLGEAPRR